MTSSKSTNFSFESTKHHTDSTNFRILLNLNFEKTFKTSEIKKKHYLRQLQIFYFEEKVFLLMVVCNLFYKAAFMNFIFPKHYHMTLLAPKCKTSFVITRDIYFLEKIFLFIATYYLSHKPGIMGFNVPTNLF